MTEKAKVYAEYLKNSRENKFIPSFGEAARLAQLLENLYLTKHSKAEYKAEQGKYSYNRHSDRAKASIDKNKENKIYITKFFSTPHNYVHHTLCMFSTIVEDDEKFCDNIRDVLAYFEKPSVTKRIENRLLGGYEGKLNSKSARLAYKKADEFNAYDKAYRKTIDIKNDKF